MNQRKRLAGTILGSKLNKLKSDVDHISTKRIVNIRDFLISFDVSIRKH